MQDDAIVGLLSVYVLMRLSDRMQINQKGSKEVITNFFFRRNAQSEPAITLSVRV